MFKYYNKIKTVNKLKKGANRQEILSLRQIIIVDKIQIIKKKDLFVNRRF